LISPVTLKNLYEPLYKLAVGMTDSRDKLTEIRTCLLVALGREP
jgi:hypothetical protein